MTIRMEHLTREPNRDNWLPNVNTERSVTPEAELSMIRQIMRDWDCDIIPVIQGSVWTDEVNEWGHNLFIQVRYSKRGWLATYAARLDRAMATPEKFTCYMS